MKISCRGVLGSYNAPEEAGTKSDEWNKFSNSHKNLIREKTAMQFT